MLAHLEHESQHRIAQVEAENSELCEQVQLLETELVKRQNGDDTQINQLELRVRELESALETTACENDRLKKESSQLRQESDAMAERLDLALSMTQKERV